MDPLYFVNQIWQYPLFLICYGVLAAFASWVAFTWAKHPVRWLLGFAIVGLAFLFLTLKVPPLDPKLPQTFAEPTAYKVWVFALALAALLLGTHLALTYMKLSHPEVLDSEAEARFPEIDAAWQEISIQLSQARIDPTAQHLYLLLAPDETLAASVVDAAGLSLFASGPASHESPVHCYAVADALLLSCAGASALGVGGSGTERLEYLCGLITAASPERPTLRGIAVLLPFEWTSGPDPLRRVAAVREDIQTIRRAFKVRCPILAIFCLNESMPGFTEFAARLPSNLRQSRCGFSVPTILPFGPDVTRRGMAWMARWFQSWSLNLMVQEIRNQDGNNRLLVMNAAFQQSKDMLAAMLESGLTMHRQAEPAFFRGSYFVACDTHTGVSGVRGRSAARQEGPAAVRQRSRLMVARRRPHRPPLSPRLSGDRRRDHLRDLARLDLGVIRLASERA